MELESPVVPEASAVEEAGKLIQQIALLWKSTSLEERRKLLLTMLNAVYVDTRKTRSIMTIKAKPPFKHVFRWRFLKKVLLFSYINQHIHSQEQI